MSFYSEVIVGETKKSHKCEWCGQSIPENSRTIKTSGIWEGEFFSGHMHLECAAAMHAADWVRDDGYDPRAQPRGRNDDDFDAPPAFTEEDYLKKGATDAR